MHGFKQNPLGSFVHAVEFCFMEFGHQTDKSELFTQAFDYVIEHSGQYLVSREVCEQNPDLMNDIFGLCLRIVKHNDLLFYDATKLESLIKFAMMTIGITGYRIAKSHSEFMTQLLRNVAEAMDIIKQIESRPTKGLLFK